MAQQHRIIPIVDASRAQSASSRRAGWAGLRTLPPLTLYIHVPWCVRKCPYCDFNSHEAPSDLPEAEYLAALTADLEQAQIGRAHV